MEWDVKIGDKINYFDPEKSYEITGYRPINGEQGLDFDPDLFREAAKRKLSTGRYSPSHYIDGSKSHRDFWKVEKQRSEEGLIINGYRLTGDNYFWLNYYRLKTSMEDTSKASAGRGVSFPTFFTTQYEYFHYVEMCEILHLDVGLLKARALGFSEIAASLCVRPYTTTPNYRVMATAYSENHLKPLLTKIWSQMDFLNEETETAFKRVRMVVNSNSHKRASLKDKDGEESGHRSEIEGIIANEAGKVRGDRTDRLFYEEAGSDKIFKEKWTQGEALITVLGSERVGTRIGWGTGGDKGAAIVGIRDMVTNPESFNVLPYKHKHTPDGSETISAMFIPAYKLVRKFADKRGYCDPVACKNYFEEERFKKAKDPNVLLMYKAEYCFTIDEALSLQGDGIFPKEELAEQEAAIDIYKTVPKPARGYLVWDRDESDNIRGVKWRQDPNGNIHLTEHPMRDEEGSLFEHLYVGGIDSIDIGSADSATIDGNKLSDFCIVIKKRIFGQSDPKYVAIYKERPKDIREAYQNAAKLLTYFGCKAVLESTRTAILTHFRDSNMIHLLMKRPRSTISDIRRGNSKMYGAPATAKVIIHYRELIYDFILDYAHTIDFLEMVQQFLRYSDEKKKEFDIVAACGMAELGDEEMSARSPRVKEEHIKNFTDIGWWTDRAGYKHYGEIPQTKEGYDRTTRTSAKDAWLYKDSL